MSEISGLTYTKEDDFVATDDEEAFKENKIEQHRVSGTNSISPPWSSSTRLDSTFFPRNSLRKSRSQILSGSDLEDGRKSRKPDIERTVALSKNSVLQNAKRFKR